MNFIHAHGRDFIVDAEDFNRLSAMTWYIDGGRYASALVNGRKLPMHRIVLGIFDSQSIDHINGNVLDNRKENLRPCNQMQNCWNRGLTTRNKSGFKGVYFKRSEGLYRAQIRANERLHSLGRFSCPKEAAAAYDAAAIRLHGEFAKTNRSMGLLP